MVPEPNDISLALYDLSAYHPVEETIKPYPALPEDKDQFAKCNRKPDLALLMWEFPRDRILRLRIFRDMYDLPPKTVLEAARKANERFVGGRQEHNFVHKESLESALETMRWKMFMKSFIEPLTLEIGMKDMFCPIGGCCKRII